MGNERVFLSLGSNQGDRAHLLCEAVRALHSLGQIAAFSSVYETEPVGELNQPAFLNAIVEIKTALEPLELLNAVKCVENDLGRTPRERWGPREIDLDIILYGDRLLATLTLKLPHPEYRNRRFVLAPLAEVAPDLIDPVSRLRIDALLALPEVQGQVFKTDISLSP